MKLRLRKIFKRAVLLLAVLVVVLLAGEQQLGGARQPHGDGTAAFGQRHALAHGGGGWR